MTDREKAQNHPEAASPTFSQEIRQSGWQFHADVSRWESGEVLPDAEKLLQLCRVFGISADELLGENAKADDASDFLSLPLWRWSLRVISPPLAFARTAAAWA